MELANDPILRLTKTDAARRQLTVAIRMFFEGTDPVAAHTLAAAGHELLRDLMKHRGGGSILKDLGPQLTIKKEYQEEVRGLISEAENFFKHADRDPEAVLAFRPAQTDFLLMDAVTMYRALRGRLFGSGLVFISWYAGMYPDHLEGEAIEEISRLIRQDAPDVLTDKAVLVPLLDQRYPGTD